MVIRALIVKSTMSKVKKFVFLFFPPRIIVVVAKDIENPSCEKMQPTNNEFE